MLVFQCYFELDKNVKISFPFFYNCGNLVDTFTFNEIAKLFFNVRWSEICFTFSKLNFPIVLHQRNHNIGPMNHMKFTHVSPKMCLRLLKMHPCGVFSTCQYHCLLSFNARRCNYSNSCALKSRCAMRHDRKDQFQQNYSFPLSAASNLFEMHCPIQ